MSESASDGAYKKISILVDDWLQIHKGESFDLDLICRQLEIRERDNRKLVAIKLAYEVKRGDRLEKLNRIYNTIDNTVKYIDWVNVSNVEPLKINFPYGIEDNSQFSFDDHVSISPGDIVVIAGNSNMGKTTWCLNLLWENMDTFPCTLMGNEYTKGKFKRRVSRMTWKSPLKEDGTPKFELIERRERWKDIIRPDNINIIDWIMLGDNFYQIGMIIDGIQSKLRNGIAVISLQKDPAKTRGRGGTFSEDLASLYLAIDYQRLTVVKAKEWQGMNPNGKMYGFDIVDGGTKFHNIREVKKCPKCFGNSPVKGYKCETCQGRGYVDLEEF